MSTPTLFGYLPQDVAVTLCKLANREKTIGMAKAMGTGAAGMAVGTAAGVGVGELVGRLYQHAYDKPLPSSALQRVVPVLGAGLGLAYSLYKAHELEEMKRVLESTDDKRSGR